YSPLQLGAALQPFPEQLFHRVSRLRRSCVMSLTLRTELQVELLTAFLNTRGPRAILSSDSYPLDHSPVVIELLFGTLSVPVASLSLRSTTGTRGRVGRKVLCVLIKMVRKVGNISKTFCNITPPSRPSVSEMVRKSPRKT
ncbi:hypothetical protein HETIRDRAFT_317777, partial [Heterobasidion irregulare TC 32-1]